MKALKSKVLKAKRGTEIKVQKILVPANISGQIILNRSERQNLATFFRLKSLSKSGVLTYCQNLAHKARLSWNTLKKRLKLLIEAGLITFKNNKIYLASWEHIRETFQLKNLNFYKLSEHDNIEHKLIELSIRDNFKRQKYKVEEAKKLYRKDACSVEELEQIDIFIPEVITLSQQKISSWLGSMNYQTAQYYLYKFQAQKVLINEPQKPKFLFQDKKTKRKFYAWPVNLIKFLKHENS